MLDGASRVAVGDAAIAFEKKVNLAIVEFVGKRRRLTAEDT